MQNALIFNKNFMQKIRKLLSQFLERLINGHTNRWTKL